MFLEIVTLTFLSAVASRHLPVYQSQTNSTKVSLVDYFTGGFVRGYDGNETGPDWLYKQFHIDGESLESEYDTENDRLHLKQEVHSDKNTSIEGRRLENKKSNQAAKRTTNALSKQNSNVPSNNSTQISTNETRNSAPSDVQSDQTLPTDEDRWIWDDGGSITTTKRPKTGTSTPSSNSTELDNRTAFDGSSCPKGQVLIKAVNMCVDED